MTRGSNTPAIITGASFTYHIEWLSKLELSKAVLQVFAVLQCFEEISAKIFLRPGEDDTVLKSAISGSRTINSRP